MIAKRIAVGASALAAAGSLALAGPAMAAPSTAASTGSPVASSAPAKLMGPAPSCVRGTAEGHWWGTRVKVYNGCSFPVRVKIVMAFWPDGSCHSLSAKGGHYQEDFHGGRYDGLQNC